uniref:Uncharacterized protein n=1 Tax=Arundo donax TaxID=35708 RepID=A0A0A9HZB2_ARUDO
MHISTFLLCMTVLLKASILCDNHHGCHQESVILYSYFISILVVLSAYSLLSFSPCAYQWCE